MVKKIKGTALGILIALFVICVTQLAQTSEVKAATLENLSTQASIVIVPCTDPPER